LVDGGEVDPGVGAVADEADVGFHETKAELEMEVEPVGSIEGEGAMAVGGESGAVHFHFDLYFGGILVGVDIMVGGAEVSDGMLDAFGALGAAIEDDA
jgi:hypothetical protein